MRGGEINCPVLPTCEAVKNKWDQMIEEGQLSIGIPCVPYNVTSVTTCNGRLVENETQVYGRKMPLTSLRIKLLLQLEKWMRLPSDKELEQMSRTTIVNLFKEVGIKADANDSDDQLRKKIKLATRTRHLLFWHDHSTILSRGYIVVTVSVVYDHALFLPNACQQSTIEEPEIHMIALSSSSMEDQVAFVPDRYDCLSELNEVVYSSNHVPVVDVARFFTGDHPAQSFERGTQQGGNYKCGGCGVQTHMIDDFAHAVQLPMRSLETIQKIATNGAFGKEQGKLKPLNNLSVSHLRQELIARGQFDVSKNKPDLMNNLTKCLKGIQRAPTLLIAQPTQSLSVVICPNTKFWTRSHCMTSKVTFQIYLKNSHILLGLHFERQ